ncbi:MAG: TIR domain-containing protein [Saprospiraceae bacterium]
MKKASNPVKVYISYSRNDSEYKEELLKHLEDLAIKKNYLEIYHDGKLLPGQDWDVELRKNLGESQVVLFMLSPSFVNSKYANEVETRMAMDMNRRGEAIITPVLLIPTDFTSLPFNRFQAVPKNEGPVATSKNRESTWKQVMKELLPLFEYIHDGSIELKQRQKETSRRDVSGWEKEISDAKRKLENGEIENAIGLLTKISKATDPDIYRRLNWLSSRYHSLEQKVEEGIFSSAEIPSQRSNFSVLLTDLIEDLNTPDKYGQAARIQ